MTVRPKILLGVTVDGSLILMRGFPEFLAARGWEVHVVSAPGPALDELADLRGVTVHSIPMTRNPSLLSDLASLIGWLRLLRRIQPDVVSVGTPKAGMLGTIAGFIIRTPHRVYHLRGLRLETESGARRRVLAAIERLTMIAAHKVVSVSASLRERAIELDLVKPSKVLVIGSGSSNGVDVSRFQSASSLNHNALSTQLGLKPGVPVIGFVGRLGSAKGLNILADARTILAKNEVDHELLVIGGADDSSSEECVRLLNESGRPIIQTGHVQDVAPYYQLMDVLCLPTLREGFPNVVLEAAASGVPAVTTNATGAVDSVLDGRTGLISSMTSASDLADRLTQVLANDGLRLAMGHNALAHVTANYDQSRVWAKQEEFYGSLR